MEPDQMRSLCIDWASSVDGIEHTYDVQKATLSILFGMINLPYWCPHIKFGILHRGPRQLSTAEKVHPELMEAIKNISNLAMMVLCLAIVWLKYKELIPQVQEQLEMVTKEVAQGRRRLDLDMYLLVMDQELRKAEDVLAQYNTWSTDPVAITLQTKINNLQQARVSSVSLNRGEV